LQAKQLEDMTARAALLQEELATVTATSAERERALQAEIAELRRYLDTIIRERNTYLSILFLYGWLIDACRPPCL
jgi:methionine aminopeptidase